MSAWPFLFAAGNMLDYQFIVCPRPLAHKDSLSAFRRLVSSLVAQPTTSPRPALVDDPSLQNILVYYLCQPAMVGGEPVTDCGHRPVHVVTGIAFDRADAGIAGFEARARELVIKQTRLLWPRFESFWNRLTALPKPEISEPIGAEHTRPTPPIRLERRRLWGTGRPPMATASAVIVVTGIAVGSMLIGQSSDDRRLQSDPVHSPPAATIVAAGQIEPGEIRVTTMIGKRLNDMAGRDIGKIIDLVMGPAGNLTGLLVDPPNGGQIVVNLRDHDSDKLPPKLTLLREVVQLKEDRPVAPVTNAENANPASGAGAIPGTSNPMAKN
jgi:hypothetical protein